ncbi:MAG TPA: tRNA pseudouridine(55) synthase TruB [Elusimicrobiales bacterium]|nr:tRNA pseudouridine(55) synthase TruB [Elusimicrobiales bacterium]
MPHHTAAPQLSGVFLADKPSGWTSHDAVMVLRRKLGESRIGHAGTLDPLATGLLVMLVGKAASRQAEFQKARKTYEGVIAFGAETDTWDAAGKSVSSAAVPPYAYELIQKASARYSGEIEQTVPLYSAAKKGGVALHRLARQGRPPDTLPVKKVSIYAWELRGWNGQELVFRLECSSGTYVRSIAQELGRAVGCGAHLKSLRRVCAGGFSVEQAVGLEQLKAMPQEEAARLLRQLP